MSTADELDLYKYRQQLLKGNTFSGYMADRVQELMVLEWLDKLDKKSQQQEVSKLKGRKKK